MKLGPKYSFPFGNFPWTTYQIVHFFNAFDCDPVYNWYGDYFVVSCSFDGITRVDFSFLNDRPHNMDVFLIVDPVTEEEYAINDDALMYARDVFETICSYDAREINLLSDNWPVSMGMEWVL